jgi:hypothetical protein
MSLIDDLRAAGQSVDPQFQPTANELPGFVAALALWSEHGDKFTQAAKDGGMVGVAQLVNPEVEQAPAGELSDDQMRAQISDMQAALDARAATAKATQVEHQPGETKDDKDKGKK